MKKNLKYILVTALLFVFTSACKEEFLEFVPQDNSTVANWYKDPSQIRSATATLYGSPWFGFNDQMSWLVGDLMAGDMFHTWDAEGQFFFFSFTANNTYVGGGWNSLYNVISFANAIIDDMPTIAQGNGVAQADIDAGLAEARFMRAMAYFYLVEYWEDVPIVERPSELIANNQLKLPKIYSFDVYEYIRRDLVFASEHLPESDEPGRVTSWSAKGMLAKLHVTIGQRKVGDSNFPSETADDFAAAAAYAADVINNSGLSLHPSYEELFKVENEHSGEILFGLQWITAGYGVGNSRQARFARSGQLTGGGAAWGGGKCATKNFVDNLVANAGSEDDLRQPAIYMQLGDHYDDINIEEGGYTYDIVSRDDEEVQLEGADPILNGIKKYVIGGPDDHGYPISNQDSPLDNYMLRLADVYLLHTEALMGSADELTGGPGLVSLNTVRDRAGLDSRASVTYEQLMAERRVELGMEGQNWLEVKRRYHRASGNAINFLNGQQRSHRYYRIDSGDELENDPAGYELVGPGEARTETGDDGNTLYNDLPPVNNISAADMVLPIPESELVNNDLLHPDVDPETFEFSN